MSATTPASAPDDVKDEMEVLGVLVRKLSVESTRREIEDAAAVIDDPNGLGSAAFELEIDP